MRVAMVALTVMFVLGVVAYFFAENDVNNRVQPIPESANHTDQSAISELPSPDTSNSNDEIAAQPAYITLEPMTDSIFSDLPESSVDKDQLDRFLAARPVDKYRVISANGDALRELIRSDVEPRSFDIRLFDDQPITIVATDAKEHSSGWKNGMGMWIGSVDGIEESMATFLITPDGHVKGTILTAQHGRVRIQPMSGTAAHIMWHMDDAYEIKVD
jgi:hypothetical protein